MSACIIEWEDKEYILKYTFGIVRRLRDQGINIVSIYRAVNKDPECAVDYGDEVAEIVAFLLREAGATEATGEDVWRKSMGDRELLKETMGVFSWVCSQHFSGPSTPVPKKKAARQKKKT